MVWLEPDAGITRTSGSKGAPILRRMGATLLTYLTRRALQLSERAFFA